MTTCRDVCWKVKNKSLSGDLVGTVGQRGSRGRATARMKSENPRHGPRADPRYFFFLNMKKHYLSLDSLIITLYLLEATMFDLSYGINLNSFSSKFA